MTSDALHALYTSMAASAVGVLAFLTLTWAVGRWQNRHVLVDVAWGLGFVLVAAISFVRSAGIGDDLTRRVLLGLVAVWGVRLALHIVARTIGAGEDPRYAAMMARAKGSRHAYIYRVAYLNQALVMWIVSLPIQVAMFAAGPGLRWVLWAGVTVWAVGEFFEAVGDWQLQRFRNDPSTRGQVMDRGLWRYTRHPNYFGDTCVWWGIYLVAAATWPGCLTVISPLLMTWALTKKTGKPLLEKGLVQTRPGYAEYVARTSGFIPWPPRQPHHSAGGPRVR